MRKARCKRESRNKKQETKRFSTFAVYRLRHSETKKTLLDSRIMFLAEHVRNKVANQQSISSHMVVYIPAGTIRWINVEMKFRTTSRRYFNYISTLFQCQMPAGMVFKMMYRYALSRNRSLRDAKPARHLGPVSQKFVRTIFALRIR